MKVIPIFFTCLMLGQPPKSTLIENKDCNAGVLEQSSVQKLPKGFNFLKSYQIANQNGNKPKVEYSYVFTKGTNYVINICTLSKSDKIFFSVYDRNRKLVANNLIKNKVVNQITLSCPSTGIYYITYTFADSLNHCGGSAIGFKSFKQ